MDNATAKKIYAKYHRVADEAMHVGPPLDLSFKNANSLDELLNRRVHAHRTGKRPDKSCGNRYLTSTLWLSNNLFASTAKLEDLANNFLEKPLDLRWLDLSYNRIHNLDDDLVKFKSLKILYLHGNAINDMKSIVKLRYLPNLRSLTLYGNPIEKSPCYRRYVVAILPHISNLDFSPVIDTEKKRALPTGFHKTIRPAL
ncbi:leucine-rich repeat-containing protein 51 [Copidosoma floridanum]|uniref:leucine-rich repeat-containing protein 51 n=1 Tax=Copidosoma floridanum TaxID=29053 RepID=UPI0006C9B09D|nr:leucine-rich repeat-containing protein 51 [Copidosoma floridanum]